MNRTEKEGTFTGDRWARILGGCVWLAQEAVKRFSTGPSLSASKGVKGLSISRGGWCAEVLKDTRAFTLSSQGLSVRPNLHSQIQPFHSFWVPHPKESVIP